MCDIFGLKLLPFRLLPKFPEQLGNDIDCVGHKCSKMNAYILALFNSRELLGIIDGVNLAPKSGVLKNTSVRYDYYLYE